MEAAGKYYTSPRIAPRLVAASSYELYIHIYTVCCAKTMYTRNIIQHTYLKAYGEKEIRWHGQICHCIVIASVIVSYYMNGARDSDDGTLILHAEDSFLLISNYLVVLTRLTSVCYRSATAEKHNDAFLTLGTFLEYFIRNTMYRGSFCFNNKQTDSFLFR